LIVAPAELPIGIVTSLLGAPFFLALLLGRSRSFGA
jgi:iron complex transport system permease protein